MTYSHQPCLFCTIPKNSIIMENALAYVIRDTFPVTSLHALIIPKRHVSSYFELTSEEVLACNSLLELMRTQIMKEDSSVEGFNVGVNIGAVAGQTISHCHVHLIPRRKHDVPNPTGGIRHVIPGKGWYPPSE